MCAIRTGKHTNRTFGEDMTIEKLALLMSDSAKDVPTPESETLKLVSFTGLLSCEIIASRCSSPRVLSVNMVDKTTAITC
jgi:hypothetical protein